MRKVVVLLWLAAGASWAEPFRVLILDGKDETGQKPDAAAAVSPAALVQKAPHVIGKELLQSEKFVLIDRRDFTTELEKVQPKAGDTGAKATPSFIHAAQILGADAVLRSSLQGFSSGKQTVDQGGHRTELTVLSVRLAVEALDAVDGTVIGMADGAAEISLRQTAANQTSLGENDVLKLMEQAAAKVVPEIVKKLEARRGRESQQPQVKLSISTAADPALVEIDGVLVGSTPLKNHAVYQGDHVITVGKPGYRDVSKRVMFKKDAEITVPMLKTELTADELKEMVEKMRFPALGIVEPAMMIRMAE